MRVGTEELSQEEIDEMIHLRKMGYGFLELGRYFKRNHSTIHYHLKKHNVKAIFNRNLPPIAPQTIKEKRENTSDKDHPYREILHRNVNYGLPSYRHYLKSQENRNPFYIKYGI